MFDEMDIEVLSEILDYENNDYLYHETESGVGDIIIEEGLHIEGTNIIDAKNISETTTLPLPIEIGKNPEEFKKYIVEEKSTGGFRDVSEMVILEIPKGMKKIAVSKSNNPEYEGIVRPRYVLGYINMDSISFVPNNEHTTIQEFEYTGDIKKRT